MPRDSARKGDFNPGKPRWWQWPTILALDAPAVALTWQSMLARVAGVTLRPYHVVLLGVSVWLAYTADRWIEGWRLSMNTVRTQRHYFFLRWRWPAFGIWIVTLAGGVNLALNRFNSRDWVASLGMLVPTMLYLLSHQLFHRDHPLRVPKEICVAAIVALGSALYPATLVTDRLHLLAAPTALFMLLCMANCLLISQWERDVDLSHGQTSLALQYSRARTAAGGLPYGIFLLGVGMAVWSGGATRTAAWGGAASAALLATLNFVQPRIGRERARLLADGALLTPLLALVFS
jgi:hypothetical protein